MVIKTRKIMEIEEIVGETMMDKWIEEGRTAYITAPGDVESQKYITQYIMNKYQDILDTANKSPDRRKWLDYERTRKRLRRSE